MIFPLQIFVAAFIAGSWINPEMPAIVSAGANQPGMTETHDVIVGIVITCSAHGWFVKKIATHEKSCVGTQAHHTERHSYPGITSPEV
jgi:hypothetical protein